MQLPRILRAIRRRQPSVLGLSPFADEFRMEGEANPADVARASQILHSSSHSMAYRTNHQMSRRIVGILIGAGWPPIEVMMLRAARNWARRQVRRFRRH